MGVRYRSVVGVRYRSFFTTSPHPDATRRRAHFQLTLDFRIRRRNFRHFLDFFEKKRKLFMLDGVSRSLLAERRKRLVALVGLHRSSCRRVVCSDDPVRAACASCGLVPGVFGDSPYSRSKSDETFVDHRSSCRRVVCSDDPVRAACASCGLVPGVFGDSPYLSLIHI